MTQNNNHTTNQYQTYDDEDMTQNNTSDVTIDNNNGDCYKIHSLAYQEGIDFDQVRRMVSNRIHTLRKANGLTLIEFSEKIGVSKPTVASWENASDHKKSSNAEKIPDSTYPDLNLINTICRSFHVSPSYILGEIDAHSHESNIAMTYLGFEEVNADKLSHSFYRAKHDSITESYDDESMQNISALCYINYISGQIISSSEIPELLLEYLRLRQLTDAYEQEDEDCKSSIRTIYNKYLKNPIEKNMDFLDLFHDNPHLFSQSLLKVLDDAIKTLSKDEKEKIENYKPYIIKYYELLSGILEMKLLRLENRIRTEQNHIMLDFCQNIHSIVDEYIQFSKEQAITSGILPDTGIIQ